MLDTLRISANTYEEIFESEIGFRTPGNVEVMVGYYATDDETGEQDWFRVVRSEGTPEQARALAGAWEQMAAELRRVTKEAERLKENALMSRLLLDQPLLHAGSGCLTKRGQSPTAQMSWTRRGLGGTRRCPVALGGP